MNKSLTIGVIAIILTVLTVSQTSMVQAKSTIVIVDSSTSAVIKTGSEQTVEWKTSDFPKEGKVNINLIRKASDSPVSYELIRQLSVSTDNDGSETWTPERSEIGENLLIEVTCAGSDDFQEGCATEAGDGQTFAIKGSFGSNLASIFDAIIEFFSAIF